MQYVYLDTYISAYLCGLNTSTLHKINYTIYNDLVVWNMHGCLLGNYRKLENGLILSLKFYFGKNNKLKLTIYALKINFLVKIFSCLLNPGKKNQTQ